MHIQRERLKTINRIVLTSTMLVCLLVTHVSKSIATESVQLKEHVHHQDDEYKDLSFQLDKVNKKQSDVKYLTGVSTQAWGFLDAAIEHENLIKAKIILDKLEASNIQTKKIHSYRQRLQEATIHAHKPFFAQAEDYEAYQLAMINPLAYQQRIAKNAEQEIEQDKKTSKKELKKAVVKKKKNQTKKKKDIRLEIKPEKTVADTFPVDAPDNVVIEKTGFTPVDEQENTQKAVTLQTFNDIEDEPLASIQLDLNIIATRSTEAELYIEPICKAIIDNNSSIIIRSKASKDYRWLMFELKRCVWRLDKNFRFRVAHRKTESENIVVDFHPYRNQAYFIKPS